MKHQLHSMPFVFFIFALINPFPGLTAALADETNNPPSDLPADYSHALSLSVTGKQGVVGFRLPQAVYLHSRSAGLNDLRVFDAQGEKTPFALYLPTPTKRTDTQTWPVKQFPLYAAKAQALDALALEIKTGKDGTLLSVKTQPRPAAPGTPQPDAVLAGLVLDLGQRGSADDVAKPLITALRFALPPGMGAYSAQVWLEVGDDLKQWDTLGAAELDWLADPQTAETLANDRLEFAPRSFRYARLSWRSGEPLRFAAITAESTAKTAEPPAMEKLTLAPGAGKKPEDLAYPAGIAIPVEKLNLNFTEPNVVLPAQVGTYRELPSRQLGRPNEWTFQALTRGVFYHITQAGAARQSSELSVPLTHYAEWVVRPQSPTTSKPTLTLFWQPATLVFLAGGQPPYTLAFGRDDVKSAATELSQVAPGFSVQELAQLEPAQAGPLQTQTPTHSSDSAATQAVIAAQTRSLILWAVLLLGVGVLGGMAWRLFKQS